MVYMQALFCLQVMWPVRIAQNHQVTLLISKVNTTNWVIPCQINKQNVFASQISTKLGGLVPSMKLFNHAYFGRVKLYGFGNIGPTFF